jgi:hypothetical protein
LSAALLPLKKASAPRWSCGESGDLTLGGVDDLTPGQAARLLVKAEAGWGRATYDISMRRLAKHDIILTTSLFKKGYCSVSRRTRISPRPLASGSSALPETTRRGKSAARQGRS